MEEQNAVAPLPARRLAIRLIASTLRRCTLIPCSAPFSTGSPRTLSAKVDGALPSVLARSFAFHSLTWFWSFETRTCVKCWLMTVNSPSPGEKK